MRKKTIIEFKCSLCGKEQPINKEKSNDNWKVYDNGAVCECGGKYIICAR